MGNKGRIVKCTVCGKEMEYFRSWRGYQDNVEIFWCEDHVRDDMMGKPNQKGDCDGI